MRALTHTETAKELAKAIGQPVIVVAFPDIYSEENPYGLDWEEAHRQFLLAAPWFDIQNDEHSQGLIDLHLILVCEDEVEQDSIYTSTKGDDPNDINLYEGPLSVYMLTVNRKGEIENENT